MRPVWRRATEVAFVDGVDRSAVIHLGRLHEPPVVLTESAAAIWQAIDGRRDDSTIVARMAAEFEVDVDEIDAPVRAFLRELSSRALITRL